MATDAASTDTQSLIDDARDYIDAMRACLMEEDYAALLSIEEQSHTINARLQALPVGQVQHFIRELGDLGAALEALRHEMETRRDAIKAQIGGADQSSQAAKAYLKSSLVSKPKKS